MSYSEPLVARIVGINKHTLVNTRKGKLLKGEDWALEANVVCYTDSGLEKLLLALGLERGAFAWPAPDGKGDDGDDLEGEALDASDDAPEALEPSTQPEPAPEKLPSGPTCPLPRADLASALEETPAHEAVAAAVREIQTRTPVELVVYALGNNPQLLTAHTADGEAVTVRVSSNANFVPGMKLKARPPASSDARPLYLLIGHCPRWRGRW